MAQVLRADRLWIFLDYDGTLADFTPTPECVIPDPEAIAVVTRLSHCPRARVAVISGRPLRQIQQLLPIRDIWLAGAYGIELQTPQGEIILRAELSGLRPMLDCKGYDFQRILWYAHLARNRSHQEIRE